MGLTLVTAPTADPISLAEAKLHLRVEHDADDSLIQSLIAAAAEIASAHTRRQIMAATWDYTIDQFPASGEIILPIPPLTSVTHVKYVDSDGALQTLSSSVYTVVTDRDPGRIVLAYEQTWPLTRNQVNAVTVRMVCGYTSAAVVPDSIKAAMKLIVGHLNENREEVITGTIATRIPFASEALLAPYRMLEAF